MLVAALLWYRQIRQDLENIGFKFNAYEQCVENRYDGDDQQTLRLHVDDMLVSYKNKKHSEEIAEWFQKTYGKLKPVKCTQSSTHTSLLMMLDFGVEPRKCHISQPSHQEDLMNTFPEQVKVNSLSPAASDLFRETPMNC